MEEILNVMGWPQTRVDALCVAILKQACADYYKCCVFQHKLPVRPKRLTDHQFHLYVMERERERRKNKKELEAWFVSNSFHNLMPRVDGFELMCKIQDKKASGKPLYDYFDDGEEDDDDEGVEFE